MLSFSIGSLLLTCCALDRDSCSVAAVLPYVKSITRQVCVALAMGG